MGPEATGLCGDQLLDTGIIWTRSASQLLGKIVRTMVRTLVRTPLIRSPYVVKD